MRSQSAAEENRASAVTPALRPSSAWRVRAVTVHPDFRLHVEFVDGLSGDVDLSALVRSEESGVFAVLADPAIFAQAHIKLGAVTWPGDIDLAPDAMYRAIKATGVWKL